MAKVKVRVPSFVLRASDAGSSGWLELEREMGKDSTASDLLSDLVTRLPGFREGVYNPETGTVNEQIGVVLNDRLLTSADISQEKLADDDCVVILPVYAGG